MDWFGRELRMMWGSRCQCDFNLAVENHFFDGVRVALAERGMHRGMELHKQFQQSWQEKTRGTGSAAHDKFLRSGFSGRIGKRSLEFLRLFDDWFNRNLKQTPFFCELNSASALYVELRAAFSFQKSQLLSHRWLADSNLPRCLGNIEMFGDGVRLAGLDLLSRLHIREGMDLCLAVMEPDRWGEKNRTPNCLKYLQRYGVHAKTALPQLRQTREFLVKHKRLKADDLAEFDKAVAAIESSTLMPELVSVKEFKLRSGVK